MTSNLDANLLSPTPPSDFRWRIDEKTGDVVIVEFLNDEATVCVFPDKIEGRPVTRIGTFAFSRLFSRSSLTSVVLPKNLQTIDVFAFNGCSKLKTLALPEGLQTIGFGAFADCQSLTELTISPNSTRFMLVDGVLFSKDGKTLVAYIESLRKDYEKECYVGPDGLETIGAGAFHGCTLTSVAFPKGLKTIESSAFQGSKLKKAILPEGLETIKNYAFASCTSLTSVVLPNTLNSVGDDAFHGCLSLRSVVLPNGLETIGKSAFKRCFWLPSVIIPAGVQIIGDDAFHGCLSLRSVVLPNGLETIGKSAFASCVSLPSVNIPASVQIIGDDAFSKCDPNLTLYGAAGSVAEKYAHENQLRFEAR